MITSNYDKKTNINKYRNDNQISWYMFCLIKNKNFFLVIILIF